MAIHNEIDTRMKQNYEFPYRIYLTKRTPVIIRLDGRAFHSFTRGFEKPFDEVFINAMKSTTRKLCENISNCVFGYSQSDEISILMVDYARLDQDPWFDNNLQKIASISASMATLYFHNSFTAAYIKKYPSLRKEDTEEAHKLHTAYKNAIRKGAMFDSRCFNIPKDEVCNYFISRQLDASRNSIYSLGRSQFSHKSLQGLNSSEIQDKLMLEKNINWNDCETYKKRGFCSNKAYFIKVVNKEGDEIDIDTVFKTEKDFLKECFPELESDKDLTYVMYNPRLREIFKTFIENKNESNNLLRYVIRSYWDIDNDIPIFTKNRDYVEKHVFVG